VVQGVYAHDRKAYKQRQCFHLVLNTMFTTRLPNFSIAIKVYYQGLKHHVYCWGIQENPSPSKRQALQSSPSMFFRSRGFAILGNLEPAKSRIRECAEFGNLDSGKRRSREHTEARNLNCWWSELRRNCWFGNLMKTLFGTQAQGHARTCWEARATSEIYRRPSSGISGEDIRESREKQSQSCSPKKSGFRVWTSGRLVNVKGGKRHSCVCSH
jgi:hypothetical protein